MGPQGEEEEGRGGGGGGGGGGGMGQVSRVNTAVNNVIDDT